MKELTTVKVSREASDKLTEYLEQKAAKITQDAQIYAQHADRKTILLRDVEQAINSI
jgi:histone H3/H4